MAMQSIYKIKIKTNPPSLGAYPSERRYSASTVQGLGVVHLILAATALLLASLSLNPKNSLKEYVFENTTSVFYDSPATTESVEYQTNSFEEPSEVNTTEREEQGEIYRVKRSLETPKQYTNLSIGPCVMTLGSLCAGLAALLAWKRWYIDSNIKWFFITSCVSILTSFICLVLTSLSVTAAGEFNALQFSYDFPVPEETNRHKPSFSLVLAVNILIASAAEVVWSLLSARVAFKGMVNDYPEDIVVSRSGGRVEVSTVSKGNGKKKTLPPDILDHFPASGKIAKYLPKKVVEGDLPNEESNVEYNERVNKFLSGHGHSNGNVESDNNNK